MEFMLMKSHVLREGSVGPSAHPVHVVTWLSGLVPYITLGNLSVCELCESPKKVSDSRRDSWEPTL